MGVDAVVQFRTDRPLERAEIKQLQYELMHRFERDTFWTKTTNGGGDWVAQDFIRPATTWDESTDTDVSIPLRYDVSMYGRYYGPDYARGNGLVLSAVLLYLHQQPFIREVFYGGDSGDPEPFTKRETEALLAYYITHGRHSYIRFFDDESGRKTYTLPGDAPGVKRPECSYCEVPMVRNGSGARYAGFYCEGCGETASVRDEQFEKWRNGEPFQFSDHLTALKRDEKAH